MHSNVAHLLAETLLKMVLTFQRNLEIVRSYERATKGRHETAHVLRYVPQADDQSQVIRTAEILTFVKTSGTQRPAKVSEGEPARARGSSYHTCHKTVASSADIWNPSLLVTPGNQGLSRRREFDFIRSHEKEALFLSDRFGERILRQSANGGCP